MVNASWTRRHFLGTAATAAAAAGIFGSAARAAPVPSAEAAKGAGNPRLSACIEALFTGKPFEERLDAVKAAGLGAYEFWGWRGKNLDALAKKGKELGLEAACFSCDTGGALVSRGSKERFLPALRDSIAAAKKLGTGRLIATVGNEVKDVPRAEQHKSIVEAVKAGAPLLEDAGMTLVLEPLNVLVNHRGYYLATSQEGFQIVDEVGSPNVKLLFDIYHQQITEGNLIANITASISKIGHFHVADVPGRGEPGTGEINYLNVFKAIVKAGYTGFLGLEMWPRGNHDAATKEVMKIFDQALAG